ncbi:methyltransferase [Spirosoma taeanense]|uniref:Methyltransferase n=2 Tax=Spirosoma taeanense TaxID=2735870 RepID=A0A6M5YG19_9BACT|nr:methyltransferase [Spirosoma taeanense]
METEPETALSSSRIMEAGMGFRASQTLLTAIKLNLFTELGDDSVEASELKNRVQLHSPAMLDFLDALVALEFLQREGTGREARYANTAETRLFLHRGSPAYIGGLLEMANDRLYPFWANLEEALHTDKPQHEAKFIDRPLFDVIYDDPAILEQFLNAMAGAQLGGFMALAEKFDFSRFRSMCDVGGANAMLSVCVAGQHPHLRCLSLDLPSVVPVAQKTVDQFGLSKQIRVGSIDFMTQEFPETDIIMMGNILHDCSLEDKQMLIRKAYDALPSGGALIVIENIIDDDRKRNAFGLLMSLNMFMETESGFDFTYADFQAWAAKAGFESTEKLSLVGPSSAVIAYK